MMRYLFDLFLCGSKFLAGPPKNRNIGPLNCGSLGYVKPKPAAAATNHNRFIQPGIACHIVFIQVTTKSRCHGLECGDARLLDKLLVDDLPSDR